MNKPDEGYTPSFLQGDTDRKTDNGAKGTASQQDMLFVKADKSMLVLSRGYFNSAELVTPQTLMFVAGVYVVHVSGTALAPLLYAHHDRTLSHIEEGKNGVTKIEWARV